MAHWLHRISINILPGQDWVLFRTHIGTNSAKGRAHLHRTPRARPSVQRLAKMRKRPAAAEPPAAADPTVAAEPLAAAEPPARKARKIGNPLAPAWHFGDIHDVSPEDIFRQLAAQVVIPQWGEIKVATIFPKSLNPLCSLIERFGLVGSSFVTFKHEATFVGELHHASFALFQKHAATHVFGAMNAPAGHCLQHGRACSVPEIDLLLGQVALDTIDDIARALLDMLVCRCPSLYACLCCVCICVRSRTRACVHECVRACMRACMRACLRVRACVQASSVRVCAFVHACTRTQVKFVSVKRVTAAILFSETPVADKLREALGGTQYHISDVVLMPGRLGSPLHGRATVTVLRQEALQDPTPVMQAMSVMRCTSGAALLAQVTPELAKGWSALFPVGARSAADVDKTKEFLKTFQDAGHLPHGFNEPCASGLPMCDALARARLEVLVYWMGQRSAKHGYVDAGVSSKPVHVDGSLSSLTRSKSLYYCNQSKWTCLLPIHKLALQGYVVLAENISVASPATADRVVCSAVNMNIVFCAVLAFCSAGPKQ